ncbi:MAG: 1-deoxy-D-xylulose-5-phosphate reductoisomerase [Acetobacteraceae bacterium]|nr:1-deoxy-D-xylulose-5-phosphate reductoisomerase [Acetobacteraceae bacterium]
MKSLVILGSTGSIGRQALEVVEAHPGRFQVVGLGAGRDVELLARQAAHFGPRAVAVADPGAAVALREALDGVGLTGTRALAGPEGMAALAKLPEADLVLLAVVGPAALPLALEAVGTGRPLALASKEALVAGGELVCARAAETGSRLIPVDSEHSGVFQCLSGQLPGAVKRVWLTGSGGPFWAWPPEQMARAGPEQALAHPNWRMGPKVTVDSATLMNKGLEVIEAHWLFGLDYDRIRVVIHRQSLVHALVELVDGSVLAQLGPPDMRLPIMLALSYPERLCGPWPGLDLLSVGQLTFEPPDPERFPCLALALEAGERGGTMPAVMSAADDVAVSLFLQGRVRLGAIPLIIRRVMEEHRWVGRPGLKELMAADAWARARARDLGLGEGC